MTLQRPRIYIYKITFEEVPYYYYGVKKEKYFNQEYWGTPITNKWCWEFYTAKKQILQVFPYTDEGWLKAKEIEDRLIRPVFNTDKWCLNECCGGKISLDVNRKTGKKTYELRIGAHGLSKEKMTENSRIGGKKAHELGLGVHGLSKEELSEAGKKGGVIGGVIGGKKAHELGLGVHGWTKEQLSEAGKKGGEVASKILNSQKWQCTITGYVTTPGPLTSYQKARGIDTSNRIRLS